MARGLSIEDLAASLRIRGPYLAALEEGRVRDLPAPAYAVGFVRAYARALGLDGDEAARRYRGGGGSAAARRPELAFPEPVPERSAPAGALALAGAVLAIGAGLAWWYWSGGDTPREADAVPPSPSAVAQPAAQGGGVGPATAARDSSGAPASPDARVSPVATPAASAPVDVPPIALAQQPPPPTGGRPAEEGRILLRARDADVWIQVRERTAGGPVLVDRVLRAGEGWTAPAREGLLLSTGNAARLEVVVDGRPMPAGLGPGQAVRRGVPLDAERLKAAGAGPAGAPQRSAAPR